MLHSYVKGLFDKIQFYLYLSSNVIDVHPNLYTTFNRKKKLLRIGHLNGKVSEETNRQTETTRKCIVPVERKIEMV